MPANAKTSDDAIVRAARWIIEREGPHALSMQAVAAEVGVRAPSLYKRFADRSALLAAVELETLALLARTLERTAGTGTPEGDIAAMARAYRRFAKGHPRLYELLFGPAASKTKEGDRARAAAARPLLERTAALVGEEGSLAAARVLTAFVHGFVAMENAGSFRLGEGVDEAYELGLRMLEAGMVAARPARRGP